MAWLLLLVPLSLLLAWAVPDHPIVVFAVAVAAIVPLAEAIRAGTEQVARVAGPAIGGLLNVTFGNMAELVLALFVLRSGHPAVVKGQITGSIIGNALLGLGFGIVVGSWGRAKQRFSRQRAGLLSSLLILIVIALLVPALFDYTERAIFPGHSPAALDESLSLGVSGVLIVVYLANLAYTLVTHRDVFAIASAEDTTGGRPWGLPKAITVLVVGTAAVAAEAEIVARTLEPAAGRLGLSSFFLGVIVLAIVGNAAEYVAAVYFARRDEMGLVMTITVGSTIQVALLTAPIVVLVSRFTAYPMNLVFESPLELIAIAAVAFAVNSIAQDGETTWFEGVLLLGVYVLLALAFYFVTPAPHHPATGIQARVT